MSEKRAFSVLVVVMLALMISGSVVAAPLAPNDPGIVDNLSLWLRNPELYYDPDVGIWTDLSGKGNDARADVDGFVGPALSLGENPAVFSRSFSAVHCDPETQELLKATNLNSGQGLTDLTIFSVQKVVAGAANADQRAVGFGSYNDGSSADHFNMSFDVTVRKDNGFVPGKNQDLPVGEFVIYAARMDPSVINMWINSTGTLDLAYTATGSSYTTSTDQFYIGDVRYTPAGDFDIAEVIVFNTSLTDAQIEGIGEWLQANVGSGGGNPLATRPTPEDGVLYESTWANLSWRPGYYAVSHDLYFGTSFDDVNEGAEGTFAGNLATASQVVGFTGYPAPEGLQPGTTYYWRVDEVNDANAASPWKGDVWSFSVPPRTAYNSSPADGAINVLADVTLNWTAGFNAQLHQVYFGENFEDVNTASGAILSSETTYAPNSLETGKTYYWRVDEFDNGVTHKGKVWSFTTVPDVPAQSTDPSLVGWWKLDEGQYGTALDVSGNNRHGVLVGDPQWIDGAELSALEFDGADDYVNINDYKGITAVDEVQQPFTVACWIRTTGNGEMVTWGSGSGRQRLSFRVDGGTLRTEHGSGNLRGNTPVDDGRWHHVALVVTEGAALWVPQTLLYVDGRADSTFSGSDNTYNLTEGADVCIGCRADNKSRFFPGAIDDVRIYDRALTAEEIQQLMLGDPKLAGSPTPERDAIVDIRDASSLNWSAGDVASSHDVYFGTDRDAVANADNSSPEFQGNQPETSLSLTDLVEFGGGDYYWRIDEVQTDGMVIAGTIWKFTVPAHLIVDDFESYNDLNEDEPGSNRIYLTWIDGFGTTTNGAVAGNLDAPFMSQGRDSAQAMPLSYDNAGKISEATMTLVSGKDWTEYGVTKLVLWFRGDPANAAERMFVALGNALVYHPDDAATQDAGWNEWVIDLQEFASQGADLANVPSITLGFGTRNAPAPNGGTGTVYFDDIALIRPAAEN